MNHNDNEDVVLVPLERGGIASNKNHTNVTAGVEEQSTTNTNRNSSHSSIVNSCINGRQQQQQQPQPKSFNKSTPNIVMKELSLARVVTAEKKDREDSKKHENDNVDYSNSPTSTAISTIRTFCNGTESEGVNAGNKTRNSRVKRLGKRKYDILYRVSTANHDTTHNLMDNSEETTTTTKNQHHQHPQQHQQRSISDTRNILLPEPEDQIQHRQGERKEQQASPLTSTLFDTFVPCPISYFWQCRNCCTLPISARAKHSVVFYAHTPSSVGPADTDSAKGVTCPVVKDDTSSSKTTGADGTTLLPQSRKQDASLVSVNDNRSEGQHGQSPQASSQTPLRLLWNRPTVQYHVLHCAAAIQNARIPNDISMLQQDENNGHYNYSKDDSDDDSDNDETKPMVYVGSHRVTGKNKRRQTSDVGGMTRRSLRSLSSSSSSVSSSGAASSFDTGRDLSNHQHCTSKHRGNNNKKAPVQPATNPMVSCNLSITSKPINSDTIKALVKNVTLPPPDANGFYQPSDCTITAIIDIVLVAQVERCEYKKVEDAAAFLRQKPLPDGYPGVKCKHCSDKRWFFNSYKQLATGLPKIEHHLMSQCEGCEESVKRQITVAKKQEATERTVLRTESSIAGSDKKMTRREYAQVVFHRLGCGGL